MSRFAPSTLALTSLLASGQILAESLRSVWSYPYFVHDLRLTAVIVFGLGVGLTLLTHTLHRFEIKRPIVILCLTFISTLGIVFWVEGFDAKASFSILVPTLIASVVCFTPLNAVTRLRALYGAAFTVFTLVNIANQSAFLDVTYFALLATIIVLFSALQALAFVQLVKENERGELTRRQLDEVIAKARTNESQRLVVRHSGRTERLVLDDIIALEAAGDYVNFRLSTGRTVMVNSSLSEFEKNCRATSFEYTDHI